MEVGDGAQDTDATLRDFDSWCPQGFKEKGPLSHRPTETTVEKTLGDLSLRKYEDGSRHSTVLVGSEG